MPDTERKSLPPAQANTGIDEQLRRAAFAVRDMREKLDAEKAKAHAPIAIVGMGCRFPAAPDINTYWQTLLDGTDAISEVPASRWDAAALYDPDPDAPGKASTLWGGLIDDVDLFDAEFFGISPREALSIDPQQRLLLETAWRALEDAGLPADRLPARQTGVYVGISTNDYAGLLADRAGQEWIDAHASLGNSVAVAAGRMSYTLGLQGPSMAVDTACSSSLVAVHLAIRALRWGEIDVGLAAGVNLTLTPELTIGFSKARMMAADGRCKTFDAGADGYVRGEGCGVLVLKRLDDALRDGDRIRSVLLGSAVNQDGRSNGLTAPNGPSQTSVIRSALADARVEPDTVSLIEAHGTGTALGDPIEAQALSEVFGGRDAEHPFVASVKTNIGHLEAAAGMAGLIKTALSLENGKVPPHLHFSELSPHIASVGFPLRIPLAVEAMPDVGGRRIAGVSSFGFSGTNAHIVMEAPPARETPHGEEKEERDCQLVAVSARNEAAATALVGETCRQLEDPKTDFPAFAATLASGRTALPYRVAIAADTASEAADALRNSQPVCPREDPDIAFLFTGQGSQYPGMARGLMSEPRFRRTIERCDAALDGMIGPILSGGALPEGRTDLVQPLLLAIEYAVADLWRSWGVMPTAVIGHSVGEIAAAAFAGALDLEEALAFVAERGRLMESRAGIGGMAAVLASADRVKDLIEGSGVVIAALNAPENTVISGTSDALAKTVARLEKAGISVVPLQVATAFHSPVLDPVLDGIETAASAMTPGRAGIPVISNLDAEPVDRFSARYWRDQAASPVRFCEGLQCLAKRGCSLFVEVGPQPVLTTFGRALLPEATFIASLKRGASDDRTMAEAAADLFTAGAPIDLSAWVRNRRIVDVPVHPFRRERFWPDAPVPGALPAIGSGSGQPLIGEWIDTPCEPVIHQRTVSIETLPFLADHIVFGEAVVPGAMYAVMAAVLSGDKAACVEDVVFEAPMTVPHSGLAMQTLSWSDGRLEIHARPTSASEWTRHVTGQWHVAEDPQIQELDLAALETRLSEDGAGPDKFFDMLASRGIELGPGFRGLQRLWRGAGEAMGEIEQPKGSAELGVPLHPAALDSCFQILGATFSGEGDGKGFLPLSLDRFEILRAAPDRFRCHATIAAEPGSPVAVGRFTLSDLAGRVFARAEGLQIKQVTAPPPADAVRDMMLSVEWIAGDSPQPGWAEPQDIASHVRQVASDLPALAETGLSEGLDALAAAHARAALDALPDPASVKPGRERLYRRLVSLAEHDSGMSAEKLLVAFPKNRSEIDLVDRCGRALPGALDGTSDALEALFATDGGEQSGLYSGHGLAARTNDLAAAALAAALKRRGNRTLSVLEIGAGTGATTQALLQQIPDDVTVDYLFTDISDGFLKAASQAFADRPEIRFARFDLEQGPAGQGLRDHGFDIVVAANVVHATRNVARSLANIRQVLAPGGLLMLAESTLRQDWWDIVFGLTDGWWRFDDTELRHDHALLDGQSWCDVLQKAGFREPVAVGVDTPGRQSIIMAQARSGNILAVHDGNDGRGSELAEALSDLWQAWGGEALVMETDQALRHLNETGDTGAEWNVVYTGGVCAPHRQALQHAFDLSRAIANSGSGTLSFATLGLHSVAVNKESGRSTDGKAPIMEIGGATLAGFAKVLALEHGELGARVIDLDPASPSPAADLAAAIAAPGPEREIAVRADGHHVARLAPQPLEQSEMPVFDPDGAYLVTGAFGGLGPHLAAWLAEQGAGRLILTGRNSPAPELAEDLKQLASHVGIHIFDICDEDALSKVIAEAGTSLKGVFHLAGGVADGAIISQEWDRFASILDAKADAALLLDRLTRSAPLDCFVLFSTSAALIGNPGQANHAAANAILDALARRRRMEGLPGLSINWGAFSEAGAVVEKDQLETMAARGVRPVPIEQGLDALGRAMTADVTNIGIVGVDWPAFLAGTEEAFPPFLERFRRQAKGPAQAAHASQPAQSVDFAAQLAGVPESERRGKLAGLIAEEAAHVLGIRDASRIDQDQALNELGLDSLLALELRNRLGAATGRKQLATLLFDYPSISALAEFFQEQVFAQVEEPPKPAGRNGQEDPDRIFAAEVETMSDAEIEALLDAEYAAATGS